MRFGLAFFALAALALAPRVALAEDDDEWAEYRPPPRLSYGVTGAFRSYGMGDGAANQLVIAATIVAFPVRAIEIAGVLEGAATVSTTCGACRVTTYRVGASARWHVAPRWAFDPWLGMGITYGIVHATGESAPGASETWFDVMAGVEVGFDLFSSRLTHVGPFASVGGSWLDISVDENPLPPAWAGQTLIYTAGLRATF